MCKDLIFLAFVHHQVLFLFLVVYLHCCARQLALTRPKYDKVQLETSSYHNSHYSLNNKLGYADLRSNQANCLCRCKCYCTVMVSWYALIRVSVSFRLFCLKLLVFVPVSSRWGLCTFLLFDFSQVVLVLLHLLLH